MDINTRLRELGAVDSEALARSILEQDGVAWDEQQHRQTEYEVHHNTQSIVMIFVKEDVWPELVVSKEIGWDRLASAAVPVMHDIIERCYPPGGTIIRAMAAKLVAGGKILPHYDAHPSFAVGHRIHVPISTNPRVRFHIEGRPFKLQPGQAYEINNLMTHSVANNGKEDRVTFIFDYVPPKELGRTDQAVA